MVNKNILNVIKTIFQFIEDSLASYVGAALRHLLETNEFPATQNSKKVQNMFTDKTYKNKRQNKFSP